MRRRTLAGPDSPRLARWLLALALALLLGQSLGSMHRVVHATHAAAASAVARPAVGAVRESRAFGGARSTSSRWFAVHRSEADCLLFDHALQASPVATPTPLPAPPDAVSRPAPLPAGVAQSGGSAACLPRGPPVSLSRRLPSLPTA